MCWNDKVTKTLIKQAGGRSTCEEVRKIVTSITSCSQHDKVWFTKKKPLVAFVRVDARWILTDSELATLIKIEWYARKSQVEVCVWR